MNIAKTLLLLGLILIILYAGFQFGKNSAKDKNTTQLIENYSFVREIAELASLEANGFSKFKTTNLANDGSWTDAMKKRFLENTVEVSVPFTAKYGVDLKDSMMHIVRKDSVVEIHLPEPKLLSYEMRLDRMETSSRTGWLLSAGDDRYSEIEKKLYAQSRSQLETNSMYLNDSRKRITTILANYFSTLKLKSVCIFDLPSTSVSVRKD